MRKYGFTLIELLIVVAIIAILAAIAVPNFLEAQTRAKVSRSVSDMRTIATGLEMYTIDHNRSMTCLTGYPGSAINGPSLVNSANDGIAWVSYRFRRLTTPVSYLTNVFPDVFAKGGATKTSTGVKSTNYDSFDYVDWKIHPDLGRAEGSQAFAGLTSGGAWRVASCGPDNIQAFGGSTVGQPNNILGVDYDASNGTISTGDIVRVGGVAKIVNGFIPAINRVSYKYNDPSL
jgi:prepilin-type N-terminal cleavage/methylation domain-containing protein